MGGAVALPSSPYQVGKCYYKVDEGHAQYVVKITRKTPLGVEIMRLPILQGEPIETIVSARLSETLHPLPNVHVSFFVPRIAGTICEALWGHVWRVTRITHVGPLLELQCAEELYELPMPIYTQNLAPLGTYLSVKSPPPPTQTTHRERMAAHEHDVRVLQLRIELASHEAEVLREKATLQQLLHTVVLNQVTPT